MKVASRELAQDGRGVKHAARSFEEFLSCLAARIRALCAFKQLVRLARASLADVGALHIVDNESDPNEERFVGIGVGASARLLVVAYTYRSQNIRIISARKAKPHEREKYEGQL